MLLSLGDKGTPIAVAKNNEDLDIVRLVEEEEVTCDILTDPRLRECSNSSFLVSQDSLLDSVGIRTRAPKKKKDLDVLLHRRREIEEQAVGKELHLVAGTLEIFPSMQRECVLLCGASGAGKSYLAGRYMLLWKKLHPNATIYIFSRLEKDPTLDRIGLEYVRIPLDETYIDHGLTMEDLDKGSLCLFDDISSLQESRPLLFKSVNNLLGQILETGRHRGIYVVVTSHTILGYKSTRLLLSECNKIVLYPKASTRYQLESYLSRYAGMSKQEIIRFCALPSRWVCLQLTGQRYVLYSNGVYLT